MVHWIRTANPCRTPVVSRPGLARRPHWSLGFPNGSSKPICWWASLAGAFSPKKTPQMGSKPISWLSSLAGAFFSPQKTPKMHLWTDFGRPLAQSGFGTLQGGPKVDFLIEVCSGIGGLEFSPGSPGSRGSPGNGSGAAVQTLPSTRRGLRMT